MDFDHMQQNGAPMFDKKGTALSHEERSEIARRKGYCMRCGVKTHKITFILRTPLTNENVHSGMCVRCSPDQVPHSVVVAWDLRNKPAPTVRAGQAQGRFKAAVNVVRTVNAASHAPRPRGTHEATTHQQGGQQQQRHSLAHLLPAQQQSTRGPSSSSLSSSGSGSIPRIQVNRTPPASSRNVADESCLDTSQSSLTVPPRSPGSFRSTSIPSLNVYLPSAHMSSPNVADESLDASQSSLSVTRSPGSVRSTAISSLNAYLPSAHNMSSPDGMNSDPMGDDSESSKLSLGASSLDTGTNPRQQQLARSHFRNQRQSPRSDLADDSVEPPRRPSTVQSDTSNSLLPTVPPENSSDQRRRGTIAGGTDDYTGGESSASLAETLEALVIHQDDPDVVRQSLHRVRNSMEEFPAGTVAHIEPLVGRYILDPRLLALASGALWRICCSDDDDAVKHAIVNSGVIDELVDALRKNPDDVKLGEWVIGTLNTLACVGSTKALIAKVGGIEAVLVFLARHEKWLEIFEWTCRCLYNMVTTYGDSGEMVVADDEVCRNVATIEDANGVAVILSAMKLHPSVSTVEWWAIKLLWRLQAGSKEADSRRLLRNMAEEGFVPVVLPVFRGQHSTSTELFQVTAELLCETVVALGDDREVASCSIECIPSVVRRMQESAQDEAVQESGCRLLATLCKCTGALEDSDAFATVALVLETHCSRLHVAELACWTLWKLSAATSLRDMSVVSRASVAMQAAVELHADSQTLMLSVCGFATNACSLPEAAACDLPVDCVVRALFFQSVDHHLREIAEEALSRIFVTFPEVPFQISDVVGVPTLIATLVDSSSPVRGIVSMWLASLASAPVSASALLSSGILEAAVGVFRDGKGLSLSSDSQKRVLVSNLLDLISMLLVNNDNGLMDLPRDIAQCIITMMVPDHQSVPFLVKAFSTIRSLLLVSASPLEINGLVDCLTRAMEASRSNNEVCTEACAVLWALSAKYPSQNVTTLSSMMCAVVALMEDRRNGGSPFHPGMQKVAAGALSSICWCIRHSPVLIENEAVDTIIANVYRGIEFDQEGVETLTYLLDVLLNLCYVAEDTLIQSGVIVVVIDMMFEIKGHEAIQEKGCTILALLASSENLQVNLSIVQTEGIDLLIVTLVTFAANECIQAQACKAFAHLSIDPESRMLIIAQGGLQLLANAMDANRENTELLENATLALLNLSSDGDGEELMASGVIQSVVAAMKRYPQNPALQAHGMGVLQNVSMKDIHGKELIAESGGVEAVVSTVEYFLGDPSLLERAFTTLWSLAVLDSNQIRIAETDGINLVINGMLAMIDHDSVQRQGCGCICTLASDPTNRLLLRSAGGADAIAFAMRSHYSSESLQTEACRALSSLAVETEATENELSALLSAMQSFPASKDLQEHACVALRNYLLAGDNSTMRSNAADVTAVVYSALSTCPDQCTTLANEVLGLLG